MTKYAFIFPGQSSQRKGMLHELYQESEFVRHTFAEASEIVGYNIPQICMEGDKELLSDIAISAPIIVTANVASFRYMLSQFPIQPALMAGHSLGEYSALTCAGVFSLHEILSLVTIRSRLAKRMIEEKQGVMTVIYNIHYEEIEQMCKQMRAAGIQIWVSCNNSYTQSCVVGSRHDVEALEIKSVKSGASYKRIVGNAPFHSPMMEPVVDELLEAINRCNINAPQYPVICNWAVQPYHRDSVISNLLQQLVFPVKWFQTIEYFKRQNTNVWVECGSGQVLTRLMKSTDAGVQSFSIESSEDRRKLMNYVNSIKV